MEAKAALGYLWVPGALEGGRRRREKGVQVLHLPGYPSITHLRKSIQPPKPWLQITFLFGMGPFVVSQIYPLDYVV